MKILTTLLVVAALAVGGCTAVQFKSPFLNTKAEYQVLNATASSDLKRKVAAYVALKVYLPQDTKDIGVLVHRQGVLERFGEILSWFVITEEATGKMLNEMFEEGMTMPKDEFWTEQDRQFLKDIALEIVGDKAQRLVGLADEGVLSAEKRRVLQLYIDYARAYLETL